MSLQVRFFDPASGGSVTPTDEQAAEALKQFALDKGANVRFVNSGGHDLVIDHQGVSAQLVAVTFLVDGQGEVVTVDSPEVVVEVQTTKEDEPVFTDAPVEPVFNPAALYQSGGITTAAFGQPHPSSTFTP